MEKNSKIKLIDEKVMPNKILQLINKVSMLKVKKAFPNNKEEEEKYNKLEKQLFTPLGLVKNDKFSLLFNVEAFNYHLNEIKTILQSFGIEYSKHAKYILISNDLFEKVFEIKNSEFLNGIDYIIIKKIKTTEPAKIYFKKKGEFYFISKEK